MSDTSKFISRGKARNGFPSCIPELNVFDYEYVAPLTIQQVMRVFYSVDSVLAGVDTPDDPETPEDDSVPGLQIEQTFNNYDEVVKFTEISDPNADPSISVAPFKIGTVHTEDATPVYGGDGIIDVDYVLTDLSNYDIAEPYARSQACSNQGAVTTSRVKYASDQVSSVRAHVNFNNLYHLYSQLSPSHSKVFLGYGFPMGAITMFAGITSLNGNQVSYGNFANDLTYEQTSPEMPPNWWGAEPGLWLGQSLNYTSEPDDVATRLLDFASTLKAPYSAPFIQATWSGRDDDFANATWSVPTLPEDCLNLYNYI